MKILRNAQLSSCRHLPAGGTSRGGAVHLIVLVNPIVGLPEHTLRLYTFVQFYLFYQGFFPCFEILWHPFLGFLLFLLTDFLD